VLLPRPSAKLLVNQFDEDLVKALMQDGCSSWAELVDRRSPPTIYVLEDQQTEPQWVVVTTLAGL